MEHSFIVELFIVSDKNFFMEAENEQEAIKMAEALFIKTKDKYIKNAGYVAHKVVGTKQLF